MRRNFFFILYPLILVFTLVTCVGKKQPAADKFPAVDIPVTLTGDAAWEYLAVHFWDNFDLTDTAQLSKTYTSKAMADYLELLAQLPENTRTESISRLLNRAHDTDEVYDRVMNMLDEYLYNISSPLHNEQTYNAVLLWQINNPAIDEVYKLRPRELYRVAQKNSVGTVAADFHYNTNGNAHSSLHRIDADYTILFFYNLGCEMCRELRLQMLTHIAQNPDIAQRIANGSIKILALYPDRERESWEKYRADIPADWINAYDPTGVIKEQEIYELRAIPSVYVLDRDKRVLVKDAFDAETIFGTITQTATQTAR